MKIFIDSADIGEIREAASLGIIDGVTTNPSLVAKTGRRFEDVLADICETVNGPISAEVISTRADEMVSEGQRLAKLHPNIVVKCPMITEGLNESQRRHLLSQIPVGRFCEPEEFAHAVRFLASPLAGFITGEIVDVNGGLQMD